MSEKEEPVAKLAKLESSMESMDEGQEEWLSEGILTDDDLPPAAENDSSVVQSQDETIEQTTEETMEQPEEQPKEQNDIDEEKEQNGKEMNTDKIEEALDNMENEKTDKNEEDITGDLGTFLVRKSDGTIIETRERRDDTDMESPRHTDEDANDTDELLRMLGDDDQKAKKKKEVRKIAEKKNDGPTSDEEDIFTGKVTRLKSKLTKKVPTKAVPEVTSDDESSKLKSRLRTPKKPILKKTPSKINSAGAVDEEHMTYKVKALKKIPVKALPEVSDDDNISSDDRSTMKKMFNVKKKVHFAAKSTAKSSLTHSAQAQREKDATRRLEALKKTQKSKPAPMEVEPEEIIRGEEFLEDDAFDMDEYREELDAEIQGEAKSKRQQLMRPEQMDEEFLSDGDSVSEDNSYYDDLPSTDSEEDLEDWFTFDIRAERAGDYLPLLGDKAHQVLSEERSRLAVRVASLRFDLAAAAAGARVHAAQLRRAAAAVAELDAAIKAAV